MAKRKKLCRTVNVCKNDGSQPRQEQEYGKAYIARVEKTNGMRKQLQNATKEMVEDFKYILRKAECYDQKEKQILQKSLTGD